MAKHTQAPWRVEGTRVWAVNGNKLLGESLIAESPHTPWGPSTEERHANAQLIAAAPDMFEALAEIHKLWCCPEPKRMADWAARCDVMADFARKAMAKAGGKMKRPTMWYVAVVWTLAIGIPGYLLGLTYETFAQSFNNGREAVNDIDQYIGRYSN